MELPRRTGAAYRGKRAQGRELAATGDGAATTGAGVGTPLDARSERKSAQRGDRSRRRDGEAIEITTRAELRHRAGVPVIWGRSGSEMNQTRERFGHGEKGEATQSNRCGSSIRLRKKWREEHQRGDTPTDSRSAWCQPSGPEPDSPGRRQMSPASHSPAPVVRVTYPPRRQHTTARN